MITYTESAGTRPAGGIRGLIIVVRQLCARCGRRVKRSPGDLASRHPGRAPVAVEHPFESFYTIVPTPPSLIAVRPEGWNILGRCGATGRLDGDTLTVQYKRVMQLSDFEDGVYRRTHKSSRQNRTLPLRTSAAATRLIVPA